MDPLNDLKSLLLKLDIRGIIIPMRDEFFYEYLGDHAQYIKFVTGFTGSNAFVIVKSSGKSMLATDGRYTVQAKSEVDLQEFDIVDYNPILILKWVQDNFEKDSDIWYDQRLHSLKEIENYSSRWGLTLKSLEENPIDSVWGEEKPELYKPDIFTYEYAGVSSYDKCMSLAQDILSEGESLLVNIPINICWLLNIRAHGVVENTPLVLGYAILNHDGSVKLFTERKSYKIDEKHIELYSLKDFYIHLGKCDKLLLDLRYTNMSVINFLNENHIEYYDLKDPCAIRVARKNDIEVEGAKKAHIADAIAFAKFLYWFHAERDLNVNEIDAVEKLLSFREESEDFVYPSFPTIASVNQNSAMLHYNPYNSGNVMQLNCDGLFLCDSGGQYKFGTTDITRTLPLGEVSDEQKFYYTLVLKGHIALATAIFPEGTTGENLDVLARQFLWKEGKDYAHGTGHGVGSFLCVHEGPQSISKKGADISLEPGMILSNEPGYYEEGKFGIRIENLIYVKKVQGKDGYLCFENLTWVPIDVTLVNWDMLTDDEKSYLIDYNKKSVDVFKEYCVSTCNTNKILNFLVYSYLW